MIVNSQHFDNIAHLAQRVETGTHFDSDLKLFRQQIETVKDDLYRYCRDGEILDVLDQLPPLDSSPQASSLLEKVIPRAGRDMYASYRNREQIKVRVRKIAAEMAYIRRLLEDELV